MRMARTTPDLAGRDLIALAYVAEAMQYRKLDRQPQQKTASIVIVLGSYSQVGQHFNRWPTFRFVNAEVV